MDKLLLVKIGFTPYEIQVYDFITSHPYSTVKMIATTLKRPVESANRVVNHLEIKGFIESIGKYPKKLVSIPLEQAISDYIGTGITSFSPKELSKKQLGKKLQVILGRKQYHQVGNKLFKRAKREILIAASGRGDFSPEFFKTMVDRTIKENIHKIIVYNVDSENKERLRNWKKNKFQVRHKQGKGINLNIYDREIVQVGMRMSDETKEKVGFVIHNESIGKFFGEFYDFLWKSSKEIDV